MKRKQLVFWLCVAVPVLLIGGGLLWAIANRTPAKYPVRGTATLANGQPASGATVMFHPGSGKTDKAIVGKANEQGEFIMMTDQPGDGVEAGDYVVTVVLVPQRKPPGEMMAEMMKDGKGLPPMPPFLKKLLGTGPPDQAKLDKLLANGPPAGLKPPAMSPDAMQPKDQLGGRYADPLQSKIRYTVTAGDNVVPPIVLR
jgi:hypothetical protein